MAILSNHGFFLRNFCSEPNHMLVLISMLALHTSLHFCVYVAFKKRRSMNMTYLTSRAYKITPTLKRFLITTMMFRNCNKITCEVCCLPWLHWHGFEPLSYTIYLEILLQYLPSQKSVPKNMADFCQNYVTKMKKNTLPPC